MGQKRWKAAEKEHASLLGAQRVYNIGQNTPDSYNDNLAIESKSLDRDFPKTVAGFLDQAESNALAYELLNPSGYLTRRIPVAVIHKVADKYLNDLVVLRMSDFRDICRELGWLGGPNEETE